MRRLFSKQRSTDTHQNVVFVERHPQRVVAGGRHCSSARPITCGARCSSGTRPRLKSRVVPAAPPRSQFYDQSAARRLDQIRAIVHEYGAIVAYWFRGWV